MKAPSKLVRQIILAIDNDPDLIEEVPAWLQNDEPLLRSDAMDLLAKIDASEKEARRHYLFGYLLIFAFWIVSFLAGIVSLLILPLAVIPLWFVRKQFDIAHEAARSETEVTNPDLQRLFREVQSRTDLVDLSMEDVLRTIVGIPTIAEARRKKKEAETATA